MNDFSAARRNMVDCQVRPNGVTDARILAAMGEIPRELFVPKHLRGIAYVDEDLCVAEGRYLMEPMVLARMLQALDVKPDDVVLDLGCATGYSTAVLARLANMVVAVDSDAGLVVDAGARLADLGVDNAAVIEGPLGVGYDQQAPYDAILVGGMVSDPLAGILDQLAEGGRCVAVVTTDKRGANGAGMGCAVLFLRLDGAVSSRPLFDAAVPPLPGFAAAPDFVF